jgi:hypothetical protein
MGRNYDRVVTPESDLPIACLKCGHVTRAFDANCPQCGASLEPRRDRPSRGSGLTIFIILGVVVSVGILLGVVSYSQFGQYEQAKITRAKSDCSALVKAANIYAMINEHFPSSIDQLTQRQPNGAPPLVSPEKVRDPWGNFYMIEDDGMKVRVYTRTPQGVIISNLDTK